MSLHDVHLEKGAFEDEPQPPKQFWSTRYTQYLLAFILIVVGFATRVSLSVAIVAMNKKGTSENPDIPTYDWDDQSIVLSSFFWGYVTTQMVAGRLGALYGPKYFLLGAMALCSVFSLLVPILSDNFGSGGAMVCRVLQGMTQGFFYPNINNIFSKWMPPKERTTVAPLVWAGSPAGNFIGYPIAGWISASWIGWPGVFYFFGGAGLTWCLVYFILGASTPEESRFISEEEKQYILKSLHKVEDVGKAYPVPWKRIFMSGPFIALFVAHCGQNWSFWTLATETPIYMSSILKFDIKSNGLLTAAPYFTQWCLGFLVNPASQYLLNRGFSIGFTRKLMHSIGVLIPAVALIGLGFVGEQQKGLAVALLIVAVGFNAGILGGFNVNHMDLSPRHGGVLMGITNGFAAVFSIVGPLAVQFIVTDEEDPTQWRTVFLLGALIYVVSDAVFCVLGSGEVQEWDSLEEEQESDITGEIQPEYKREQEYSNKQTTTI